MGIFNHNALRLHGEKKKIKKVEADKVRSSESMLDMKTKAERASSVFELSMRTLTHFSRKLCSYKTNSKSH